MQVVQRKNHWPVKRRCQRRYYGNVQVPTTVPAPEHMPSWEVPFQEPLEALNASVVSVKPCSAKLCSEVTELTTTQETPSESSRPCQRFQLWRRKVLGLLNKVSERNEVKVLEQLVALKPQNAEELAMMSDLIYSQILQDPGRMKLYVRLLPSVSSKWPRFEASTRRNGSFVSWKSSRPMSLLGRLLHSCQATFDRHCSAHEDGSFCCKTSPLSERESKDAARTTARLLGELFLEELVSPRILAQVFIELLRSVPSRADERTEVAFFVPEFSIECACEVLGVFLKAGLPASMGKEALSPIWRRLRWLREAKVKEKSVYSARLRFKILDVMEALGQ